MWIYIEQKVSLISALIHEINDLLFIIFEAFIKETKSLQIKQRFFSLIKKNLKLILTKSLCHFSFHLSLLFFFVYKFQEIELSFIKRVRIRCQMAVKPNLHDMFL
jgi:hypothetical protein